ncbi:MAG: hypothetical protein S4CHLAM7_03570 [Chlamydiae bacterium]|nr:hypothetical protein [Chlamydiota bacterium]
MTKPKLTFIGRQYHSKTKSDQMILDILEKQFSINLIRREQYTDTELVARINSFHPEVVFFWCLPPSTTKHLWKIKCKNVVWAPMWDGFKPLKFRKRMLLTSSKLKVLCFSKALYNYFLTTKMPCQYWQCALKPSFESFKSKPPYTLFLWQRESQINLENIIKFIGIENIGKVIYKSEIGNQLKQSYPFEIELLSDWLTTEDYRQKIQESDFYIAPRTAEGIGFSFLEAMSYGKVILAYNESTMNEYLIDGENGYLFDESFQMKTLLKSPLALSEKMKEHANHAYLNWEETKSQIVPFFLKRY